MSAVSEWRCPKCRHKLIITESGDYRCIDCGEWRDPDIIDPMRRDWARNEIVIGYNLEKVENERQN
jgi:DNA-directed RNA polymerase subunit RPC12/RpoP